jgi:AcrR family transcriptional regulator
MAERKYRMRKRAENLDATRERIVEATAELHLRQGVVATTYLQIAERAGVGPATVYRHFPTLGSLVEACGAHVYAATQPPQPDAAPALFAGLVTRQQRMERLVTELDAYYRRGAAGLEVAGRDRDRVPELDDGLRHVEAGVEALVRQALGGDAPEAAIRLVTALAEVSVWRSLARLDAPPAELRRIWARLLDCAIAAAAPGPGGAAASDSTAGREAVAGQK